MKMKFYLASLLLMLTVITGCHNDSPDIPDGETSEEDIRANKAVALLSFFCKTEYGADGKVIYTPEWGTVLYDNNPTVRYVVADDLDDARRWFSYFVQAAEPNITQDVTEYKIEGHGSIRFITSTTPDRIATIRVDFATLPKVKEFVFITKDRWPDNSSSPFEYESVYRHKATGYRYVCIASSQSGEGCLITFDNKKWDIMYDSDRDGLKYIYIKDLCSSVSDFELLRKFMYCYDHEEKKFIKNEVAVDVFEGHLALAPKIYSDMEFFERSEFKWILWYVYSVHKIYSISPDHSKIIFKKWWYLPGKEVVNPDLSAYILLKCIHFSSSPSSSSIEEFEEIPF